ncbi:MAG: 23S rRNA (adenine(2030)-N(6))-methyltransferase RlmJ [Alphaproteobacteria bacterium]
MLSYQHAYHAGNLADIHKHVALAAALDYLTQKPKPVSYIETHAGRGLYDLSAAEALKTGEAASGIGWLLGSNLLPPQSLYARTLRAIQDKFGRNAYAGSPLMAQTLLRPDDRLFLAELHPQEYDALAKLFAADKRVKTAKQDGLAYARGLLPPTPRRGLILIDPSYEIKSEYEQIADFVLEAHKKWPVGVIMLWYPLLAAQRHEAMITKLERAALPKALRHEVDFSARNNPRHGMRGSGLYIINTPFGLDPALGELERLYQLEPSP